MANKLYKTCTQNFILLSICANAACLFALPVNAAFAINKIFLYIMVIYGNAVIIVPKLLVLPVSLYAQKSNIIFLAEMTNISCWNWIVHLSLLSCTCIELDIIGENFSSLTTLPTLLCTLTKAFISLDSNKFCRKLSSCSLDKLSASFNDVTNFNKTEMKCHVRQQIM